MNSQRLNFLRNLIPLDKKVIDIGTDHAYLPIMLYQKGIIKVMGSDIHQKALDMAYKNIISHNLELDIPLVLSDGLKDIDTKDYNTLVLAGMGFMTIKHILDLKDKLEPINTIYIQSNNDYNKLRSYMNENKWILKNEYIIEEKKIIYHIMEYERGEEKLREEEILFGKRQEKYVKYYQLELNKLEKILNLIPKYQKEERKIIKHKILLLQNYLR